MDVTLSNFADTLSDIESNIRRSSFIAFDAEFTAIIHTKHRLFDSNEDRYYNLKSKVNQMIMTQIGLTMFHYNNESYEATTYTFHLRPQAFGDVDQSFILQASNIRFLTDHQFDFNKFLYSGIPYLSQAEEVKVRQKLKNKTMVSVLTDRLQILEERELQNHCSQVSKWLISSTDSTLYLDVQCPVLRYLLHNELRLRFPNVITTDSLGNSKKILIYRDKNVQGADAKPMETIEENLMSSLLGFSQVILIVKKYQKPIVGHNIFADLVLFHNQFIGPLPSLYSKFKRNIHEMFPYIYDTKYISYKMAKKLTFNEVWKSNMLQDLYEFFSEGKCKKLERGLNRIRTSLPFNKKHTYHEAGWDAYCSGYCFMRMGHWAACENIGHYNIVGPTQKLAAMSQYCNQINVIRGAVPYMNLAGEDPPRHRPNLLHVKALKERVINVEKMVSLLANFGSVDIKPYGRRTALLAASSHNIMQNILTKFKTSTEYRISIYSVYKHSPVAQLAMWGGALMTGSLAIYLLNKKIKVLS